MKRYALLTLFVVFLPGVVRSQDYQWKNEEVGGKSRSILFLELDVSPQPLPEPALQYPLLWGFDQRTKGNAAIKYNMAMRELAQYRTNVLSGEIRKLHRDFDKALDDPEFLKTKKEARDAFEKELAAIPEEAEKSAEKIREEATPWFKSVEYSHYCSRPREKFPMDKAKEFVEKFQPTWRFLEAGSRCDDCDWEYHIRGNRNPLSIILPEIQECRDLGRALQVKAKLEIYEGRFEDAVQTIRVGKALARHVGQTPIIVASLVGVAMDGRMNSCLMEMMKQPDAPNLYWSLTALPMPVFSPHDVFGVEMDWIRFMIPELVKAMDRPDEMSDEDWKTLDRSLRTALIALQEDSNSLENLRDRTLSGLVAYPYARQWLIERGKTETEIDAMPTVEVLGLWSVHRYQVQRDSARKLIELPYWQFKSHEKELEIVWMQTEAEKLTPMGRMAELMFPATGAYLNALTRSRQTHDAMRLVEAIRLHASKHDGKLPEKLDDIKGVPVPPLDFYSGKPFDYKIEDGAAVIESDAGYSVIRYIVRVR